MPARRYRLSTFVGFRHPVIHLHAVFKVAFAATVCCDGYNVVGISFKFDLQDVNISILEIGMDSWGRKVLLGTHSRENVCKINVLNK